MKWKSKWFKLKWILLCATILASDASDASSSSRRHRREGEAKEVPKKKKRDDICVFGYCLDAAYNSLELPTKVKATHVQTSLEVS